MRIGARGKFIDFWSRAVTGPICFESDFDKRVYWPKLKKEEFVTFIFDVTDGACEFRAENGNGKVLVKQEIPFTDLDVNVKFFFTNNVLMFPSDY